MVIRKNLAIISVGIAGVFSLACAGANDENSQDNSPVIDERPVESYDVPTVDDFEIEIAKLSEQCFGSAGCNVEFEIDVSWSVNLDPTTTYRVTYEINGGDDSYIETIDVFGNLYSGKLEGFMSTSSADAELEAIVTSVRSS